MKNISNDTLRIHIYEEILQCGTNIKDEVVNCYELYTKKLNLMKDSDTFNPIYTAVVETSFIDAYKILNYRMKTNSIKEEERELYNKIKYFYEYSELENAVNNDETLLTKLLPYVMEFYDMNYFSKIMTIESLNLGQQNALLLNYELFDNDIENYSEDVTIKTIGKYCKEVINDVDKRNSDEIINVEDNLLSQFEGLLNFLVGNNFDLYQCLMEDIIELDYKWNKYLIDHGFTYLDESGLNVEMRMANYEENDLNSLIYDECMVNFEYVEELLTSFMMIKCYNMNMDEKQINEKMVNEYFSKLQKLKRRK